MTRQASVLVSVLLILMAGQVDLLHAGGAMVDDRLVREPDQSGFSKTLYE